jgi:hypothetical protein
MILSRNLKTAAIAALALSLYGCGKKKSKATTDAGSSDLTISGGLNITGEDSTGTGLTSSFDGNLGRGSVNLVETNELSIFCVTFALPPSAGTGAVAADGAFSVNIANGKDASVGCFILKGETQLGTIVFEDPSEKDLSGGAATSDKTAFSGNANLGSITFNLETGKAIVDLSKVVVSKKVEASAGAAFDFTGTYKISASGVAQPTGYAALCPPRVEGQDGGGDCRGPSEGESIYFRRIAGKSTANQQDVYGVMAWASKAAHQACGEKLGMTYEEFKSKAQVDLSGSGVAEGAFTWSSGYVDGWKKPGAVSRYSRPVNRPITVNGIAGLAEGLYTNDGATYVGFEFRPSSDKGGGCKDAAGKPVQLGPTEWQTLVYNNDRKEVSPGTKIYESSSSKPDGSVKCTFIGGRFAAVASTFETEASGTFTNENIPSSNPPPQRKQAPQGQSCATIEASDALEGARCYADNLHGGGGGGGDETQCVRRIDFNWGAKSAAEFVGGGNGPVKAGNMYVFEKFRYDSATSGSFREESEFFEGLDTGNGWTNCRVIENMTFAIKAIPGSKDLFVEMQQSSRNADPKPACIAAYKDKNGGFKSQFKMVPQ